MSGLTYSGEVVTLHDALEALTLGDTADVDEGGILEDIHRQLIALLKLLSIILELGQVSLGRCSGLLEVTLEGLRDVLLSDVLVAYLDGAVAILLHSLDLSNDARTGFDNSAWDVLPLGTEDGCHSDFLS